MQLQLEKKMKTEIAIKNEPVIDYEMNEYWALFWDLNDFRVPAGYGLSPIPKTELLRCAREHFFDEEETATFIAIMKIMDRAYREAHHNKTEQKLAQQKEQSSMSRRRR